MKALMNTMLSYFLVLLSLSLVAAGIIYMVWLKDKLV
jgi:hypothetical protein